MGSLVLKINYLIRRVPTGISPKLISVWSENKTLFVEVVVTSKKLTSAEASG